MVITSGDPSNLALAATSLIRFSLLATSARRAPLLAYSYARCFQKQIRKTQKQKPIPLRKLQKKLIGSWKVNALKHARYLAYARRCSSDKYHFSCYVLSKN